MEGSHHTVSPTDDQRPLVSPSQQRPTSGDFPVPEYPIQGVPGTYDDRHREADIADHQPYARHMSAQHVAQPQTHESASMVEQRAVDWIVPVTANGVPPEQRRTVGDRLQKTLEIATAQQAKYAQRAKWASLAVNGAMFAQIVVNALVTGLSASTDNRHAQIGVSALGAIGTILASFLVRVRGTREPERSVTHSQNLEKFIRELDSFILDEGHSRDPKWDSNVKAFRMEFDNLQTAVHQSENGQPMSSGPSSSTMGDEKKPSPV